MYRFYCMFIVLLTGVTFGVMPVTAQDSSDTSQGGFTIVGDLLNFSEVEFRSQLAEHGLNTHQIETAVQFMRTRALRAKNRSNNIIEANAISGASDVSSSKRNLFCGDAVVAYAEFNTAFGPGLSSFSFGGSNSGTDQAPFTCSDSTCNWYVFGWPPNQTSYVISHLVQAPGAIHIRAYCTGLRI